MSKRLVLVLSVMWLLVLAVSLSAAAYNYMNGVRYAEAVASDGNSGQGDKFDQIELIYDTLLRDYYVELDPTVLAEGAIEGMLAAVGDPYTFYYTAEEWSAELSAQEGEYAGIGVQVLEDAEAGGLLVTRAFADSPAYRAGLHAGDLIVGVDGYSVAAALSGTANAYLPMDGGTAGSSDGTDGATGEDSPAATEPVDDADSAGDVTGTDSATAGTGADASRTATAADSAASADDVASAAGAAEGAPTNRTELLSYMRGTEGSSITLTIQRAGEVFDCELTREVIHINRVEYCMLDGGDGYKVGYMVIYEFQGDAAEGVKQAVEYFNENGAQALVVDLRNNPGGELGVVTSIVETLLPEGMYAYIEDRHGNRQEFYSKSEGWGRPMAVLVNGYSASASELFTGAAKDMGAAVIVGETTFGKGIVQSVIALPDGSGYQFTSARYFTPSGHVIQGNGITPDVYVEPSGEYDTSVLSAMIAEGGVDWQQYDAQLLAAYQQLTAQLTAQAQDAGTSSATADTGDDDGTSSTGSDDAAASTDAGASSATAGTGDDDGTSSTVSGDAVVSTDAGNVQTAVMAGQPCETSGDSDAARSDAPLDGAIVYIDETWAA